MGEHLLELLSGSQKAWLQGAWFCHPQLGGAAQRPTLQEQTNPAWHCIIGPLWQPGAQGGRAASQVHDPWLIRRLHAVPQPCSVLLSLPWRWSPLAGNGLALQRAQIYQAPGWLCFWESLFFFFFSMFFAVPWLFALPGRPDCILDCLRLGSCSHGLLPQHSASGIGGAQDVDRCLECSRIPGLPGAAFPDGRALSQWAGQRGWTFHARTSCRPSAGWCPSQRSEAWSSWGQEEREELGPLLPGTTLKARLFKRPFDTLSLQAERRE